MSDIETNLSGVQSRIDRACERAERAGPGPALVAVSKTHGADRVHEALDAGHRRFGENRVQEAQGKWPALNAAYPDVRLHLIGGLQTNKAKFLPKVPGLELVHSLDREKLADTLERVFADAGRKIDVLLQSSPLDRRVIFEEAAGISKYRVKKAEALRAAEAPLNTSDES